MSISLTAFKKLTVAKIKDNLPFDVTSGGKRLFTALLELPEQAPVTPAPTTVVNTISNDQLVDLVLKARSESRGDSAHVRNAQKIVDTVFPKPSVPTAPAQPTIPTTSQPKISGEVAKPHWLGAWSGNVEDAVKEFVKDSGDKITLLVAYNIPNRDNGNYSAGGLANASEYDAWIKAIAKGVGTAKAIVILEPDALGHSRDFNEKAKADRYAMLNAAIKTLKANKNTLVYIDSSTWAGVDGSVDLLSKVSGMDGFSCNVSGFNAQSDCIAYGNEVATKSGLHYIVDTSRNGNGAPHPGRWCNMTDTKVGVAATTVTGIPVCDAFLWVKVPGESDGNGINDDGTAHRKDVPDAGKWFPEYAEAIYSGDWTAFKKKFNV